MTGVRFEEASWAARVLVDVDCDCRDRLVADGVMANASQVGGPDGTTATFHMNTCRHSSTWLLVHIDGPSGDPVGIVVTGQNFALRVLLDRAPQGGATNLTMLHQALLHPQAWSAPPPVSDSPEEPPTWDGLDPVTYLVSWASAGYRWAHAAPLAAAGIDPPNLYLWTREGFTFDETTSWAPHVDNSRSAAAYRTAGFVPEVAAGWYANSISRLIVAETAATLRGHGWTPKRAAQGYQAVREAEPDARFTDPVRLVPGEAGGGDTILIYMAATGRPVADALACHLAGLSSAEAADPALDMGAVRAMAALRKEGGVL